MNAQEYKEYEADVADFFKREGITNLSSTYNEETGEGNMEPFFSWSPCHCCGTTLGGDRQECAGYNPTTKEVQTYSAVCMDCEYYAEYGQLDDMTMLDIGKDQEEIKRRHTEDMDKELKAIQRRQREFNPYTTGKLSPERLARATKPDKD